MIPKERRAHQRYIVGVHSLETRYADAKKACGHVLDYSAGGMSFDSNDFFHVNSEFNLDLKFSFQSYFVPAKVRIIWSKPSFYSRAYTYGAQFVTIDPESSYTIVETLLRDWKSSHTAT